MLTAAQRRTVFSSSPPSTPRLRLGPPDSGRTLLDGAWWPRSTDPVAELPGLILAIDALHGPIKRVMLHHVTWSSRPGRLDVAGRVVRLGYFASQPTSLLTALCDGGGGARIDLLVIPVETNDDIADAAMTIAAASTNQLHADDIIPAATIVATQTQQADAAATNEGMNEQTPVRRRYRSTKVDVAGVAHWPSRDHEHRAS